jgi:hypothetical protein
MKSRTKPALRVVPAAQVQLSRPLAVSHKVRKTRKSDESMRRPRCFTLSITCPGAQSVVPGRRQNMSQVVSQPVVPDQWTCQRPHHGPNSLRKSASI